MRFSNKIVSNFIKLSGSLFLILFLISCQEKETVDLLLYNANIYTVDSSFSTAEALAIKDQKIVAVGQNQEIRSKYTGKEEIDTEGKTIIPGLFDAHYHFTGVGSSKLQADLRGAASAEEMLKRVEEFQSEHQLGFIRGRGWDQSLWPDKRFPTKDKLDELFPDTPVLLTRVDGHALLANQKLLDLAKIDENSSVEGGTFIKKDGKLTGVLIDNAMNPVYAAVPPTSRKDLEGILLSAQKESISYGLTSIADAGVTHNVIQVMDSLAGIGVLKIGIYPMLIYSDKHLDQYLKGELGKNENISVHAIKLISDGALGSRGATLKEPYSDDPGNYGKLLRSPEYMADLVKKVAASSLQLNTHAIGDSANHVILTDYSKALKDQSNRRWRIEHAQIIDSVDVHYFNKENIIPSIQPTHAISDMTFAEDRLGSKRLKDEGYIYKELLDQAGIVAIGTDAPVEEVDPYRTFYTAVARKNRKHEPQGGFLPDNALSRKETLKGMTIWAAYAQFEEDRKGSLEPGKQADFVILDRDLMKVDIDSVLDTRVEATYIKGEKVYPN